MPSQPAAIAFKDVSLSFERGGEVLQRVTFEAQRGELVAVLGASGSGKSTLLRLTAGLLEATSGEVSIAGEHPRRRRDMAFVFQDATLLPWLNTRENIETVMRLQGQKGAARREKARQLARLVGLEGVEDYYPHQLSGGMRMRVSIARSLSVQPAYLCLDEPFGALDAVTRNRLNEELLRLQEQEGFTALFVTHSVSEAVFLAKRILLLGGKPGRIWREVEVDLPDERTAELRETEAFQRAVGEVTHQFHEMEAST